MAEPRQFQKIDILIPGYSIEDLPTDLNERGASSLLNAFSVAWHPWLLSAADCLPAFKQAEATELPTGQHIVLIPECSEDWLGHEWKDHFDDTLSVVLYQCSDRAEWLSKIEQHFATEFSSVNTDLLNHFFALGTCHLQVALLSRRMHHYVDPDHYLLESEALAAARAAISGNSELAHDHLRRCFECLLDCREQFQPVNCYLVDLCLPSDQTTAEDLGDLFERSRALSLICSGKELCQFDRESSRFRSQIVAAVLDGRLSLMTGHQNELRTSLGSLSTVYSDIAQLPDWLKDIAIQSPLHWARRRFGMSSSLPALLRHFAFRSALHVVLDDGIYPDREYGQLSWRGGDGTVIPAVSRIPLAIDGASSFLRFADRFTESMQEDSCAVMMLARLPNVQTPWLQDLQIACSYAPVLGAFVTMSDFIDQTGDNSIGTKFDEGEYLSPYLIQSSVLKTESPVSSPAELYGKRALLESCSQLDAICTILKPRQCNPVAIDAIEWRLNEEEARRIDSGDGNTDTAAEQLGRLVDIAQDIVDSTRDIVKRLAELLPFHDADVRGVLVANPLPWKRSESMVWPSDLKLPGRSECITDAWHQSSQTYLNIEVPAGGFVWLCEADGGKSAVTPAVTQGKPLAENLLLRNRFFEVEVSESTGGLLAVRFHHQRANRVSQQVSFRYPDAKNVKTDEGEDEVVTSYARTRLLSSRILNSGSAIGEVETTCEITDVSTNALLARFRQTFRVERNSTLLKLRIDFDEVAVPVQGNPWMTYFACRFAWDNEAASITRSMLGQASGFRMERFETPDYIEVADSEQRVLIVPHGRPYHRRSGPRMLDSLLIVEGETESSFDFTLDFDQPLPMRAATAAVQPCVQTQTSGRCPKSADSGWLLGLSAKNVVAARTRVERLLVDNVQSPDATVADGHNVTERRAGASAIVTVLLQETEGTSARCAIRTVRTPLSARLRLADGTTVSELAVGASGVVVEFSAFQLKEVELTF